MFILGLVVATAAAILIGMMWHRRQQERFASAERVRSSQFRRITALENEIAQVKASGATAVRNERLRNAREFSQYKTLLRRADSALAQAKADRDGHDQLRSAA